EFSPQGIFEVHFLCASLQSDLNMATTLTVHTEVLPNQLSRNLEVTVVPWYIWSLLGAVVSVVIGGYWDISWHISIGRDTFWTPAHMMIYLAGVLAGVASGYAILSTTFGQ